MGGQRSKSTNNLLSDKHLWINMLDPNLFSLLMEGAQAVVQRKKKKKVRPEVGPLRSFDRLAELSLDYDKAKKDPQEAYINELRKLHEALSQGRNKPAPKPKKAPKKPEKPSAEEGDMEEEEEYEEEENEEDEEQEDAKEPEPPREFPMKKFLKHLKSFDPRFDGCIATLSIPDNTLRAVLQNTPPLPPLFTDGAEFLAGDTRLREAALVQSTALHFAIRGLERSAGIRNEAAGDLVSAVALMMHSLSRLYTVLVADALDVSREDATKMALLPTLPPETHSMLLQGNRFRAGGGGAMLPATETTSTGAKESVTPPPTPVGTPKPFPLTPPQLPFGPAPTPTLKPPAQLRFSLPAPKHSRRSKKQRQQSASRAALPAPFASATPLLVRT
jgi:hypothetical protein